MRSLPTRVAIAARTDLGPNRDRQEDYFLVAALGAGARREPPVFEGTLESDAGIALAALDAMGGSCSGEQAAILSAETIPAHLGAAPLPEGDAACEERVRGALIAANHAIDAYTAAHLRYRGMACAATLAWITGDRLHLAQAGDTRAYVLRAGRLTQVTRDDTLVNDAAALGVPADQLAELPRNVIVRVVGMGETFAASSSTVRLCAGDVILLCSDGLHAAVDAVHIERTLRELGDLGEACLSLVNQALGTGVRDNLTVIVARPEGDSLRPPGPGDVLASAQPEPPR